jgi:hypothetical protein
MVLLIFEELVNVVVSPVVFGLLAACHEKLEDTLDVKLILMGIPEHTVAELLLVTLTVGTTFTVTLIGLPMQEPVVEVGVIVYVKLCCDELVLFSWSLMVAEFTVDVLSPVIFALSVVDHEKLEATLAAMGILSGRLLQMVVGAIGLTVTAGTTLTVKVNGVPAHVGLAVLGVIV